ncbi:hypothetical protein HPP92_025423 [Vanilla planifolia]|uniref:Dof zinc finger protein n=1 Tax=Vanilla planifolia TaxID=51239 RepID=A0A835U8Z5_VANPL|nr:hypothetical protein HPP92_025423 [Vanilla planifolia]
MAAEKLSLKKVVEESFGSSQVHISGGRQAGGGKRKEPSLRCPRCESSNTKFCYYNNYSQAQPRYLCRACRRYWTEGGALRNVPVGGASKCKRGRLSAPTAVSSVASLAVEPLGVVFPNLHHLELLRHVQPPLVSDVPVAIASSSNLPFSDFPPSPCSWSTVGHEGSWDSLDVADEFTVGEHLRRSSSLT